MKNFKQSSLRRVARHNASGMVRLQLSLVTFGDCSEAGLKPAHSVVRHPLWICLLGVLN